MRATALRLVPVLCVGLLASAVPASAVAQAPAAPMRVIPRMPDGRPDLQGNWATATLTPLERPAGQGPALSEDEVARIEGREARIIEAGLQPSDPDRDAPDSGGGVGGYDRVYFDRGDRVAVVNGEPRSSLVVDPPDGRVPELTADAQDRRAQYARFRDAFGAFDHPELRPLGERCLMSFGSSAGPPMLPNDFYNNNYTLVQTPDHVMILAEMVHDARIIRIGDGSRLPEDVRPWMGESWGEWVGDTLVVETTNLHPLQRYRGNDPDNLRVIEHFYRQDAETLVYRFTVHDPTTYTDPWTAEIPWTAMEDKLYEYACHEGNYALHNILSGARYEERQESAQRADPR